MASRTGIAENEQIISALREKRALIARTIEAIEREISQHRAELEHIEAVLRIFNPNFAGEPVAVRSSETVDAKPLDAPIAEARSLTEAAPEAAEFHANKASGVKSRARKPRPRKKQQARYFRRGELPELCLEVLRSAGGSLLQSDGIADEINRKKGFVSAADSFKAATATQTRPVLRTLAKRGIVRRVGSGKGSKWRLAQVEAGVSA
jgi:hypothetical protein